MSAAQRGSAQPDAGGRAPSAEAGLWIGGRVHQAAGGALEIPAGASTATTPPLRQEAPAEKQVGAPSVRLSRDLPGF